MTAELNAGFSKRELKLLAREGYAATSREKLDGSWYIFLEDADPLGRGQIVTLGEGDTRIDALRDALAKAQALPRCTCGGPISDRYRVCVRCDAEVAA